MIGTTVGKYRILERLGRGGMGIVYKALDETLDRVVAIKVLNPDLSDAELLKRFRSEAVSLARLNHPGIATIYELHRHDDELLMVMEFVRGETLQTLSERLGPLEPPQATHVIVQILDALTHAHRAGVVHRDLKPANVMVSDTGMVKVMDFGIARMLGGEHFTQTGFMMGTPAYMAPEQVLGQEIDGRADLYSVGVLFYRLLSRELPFKADTAISMAQKQIAEAPTPIGKFRPDLPAWCAEVITKALSKSPDDRYQTAEAFRSTLTAAVTPANLGDLPTMATPTALDLTLPQPSKVFPPATDQADLRGTALTAASGVSAAPSPSGATPGPATAPVERTGSSVVLGPKHLVSLGALLALLIAAIAVVGFFAFKRNNAGSQTAVTPPAAAVPEAANTPAPAPDQQPTAVTGSQPPQPAPAETPAPSAAVPPAAVPPASHSSGDDAYGQAGATGDFNGTGKCGREESEGGRSQNAGSRGARACRAGRTTTAAGRTASPSTEAGGPRGYVQGR